MSVKTITLVKIAAVGGVATIGMGMLARAKIQENIRSAPFYRDALKSVRAHPGAVHLLGEPIKERAVDTGDVKNNFCKDNQAQFKVPVKGPKQRGTIYFWASRVSEEASWNINRIELEVEKHLNKRLIIKNVDNKAKIISS